MESTVASHPLGPITNNKKIEFQRVLEKKAATETEINIRPTCSVIKQRLLSKLMNIIPPEYGYLTATGYSLFSLT